MNARTAVLAGLEVSAENRVVRWEKPLNPDAKAVVKLPAFKGCTVTVRATFQGEQPGPPGDIDICREKNLRLTD